ncbi:retrotransposon protein, putative, ty1-copia subclass [Tanacetum coccineum]
MTTTVVNNLVFRAFFEKQRLTGPNFIDWYRNLRIVLSVEDKLPFLEQPIPAMPVPPVGQVLPPDVLATHSAWVKASKEIAGLMLMTMDPDIQKNLEQLGAYDMLKELKTLYAQQAEQELLQTVREFHACKQEEGQSVSSYILKMKSYIDNLERLGHAMTQNLVVSLILVSLRKEYDSFVQNYNMHGMGKTVTELHAMLKLHEQTLPKKDDAPALHTIREGKKDNPAKDAICHQCGDVGHWKRNCPQYLAELLKNKKLSQGASTSGIFTIELYTFPNNTWVYDTGCGTHICITTKGLRGSRKLKSGALSLYVGDGHRATVEAIGSYYLCLPSGLVLLLHNCHYAPSITGGIISVSRLYDDGFINRFDGNTISVSRNNVVYFSVIPRNVERAKDLLGLIHTDVCGPFKTVSKQGASYFVTFTDDFSRYGYVYLLKHKYEVFETFKVFQKEVENQLGKTIKSLRSDRGGEYISQEFLDHLKEHGIIAHRTPLYTQQHNGMSERRNRTLLDMVRSMMSQTTLPKSFWDYALESTACILNMVPTKKVEKIPYKGWHEQALKLSYLKFWGCEALVKRDTLTKPDKLEPISIKCIFIGYPQEIMGYSFYYLPENKILVARNVEFLKNNLIAQEASGSLEDLKIIQEEDTNPSKNTNLDHDEDDQELDEPQSDINPIRRSIRTRHAPDRMCLYIDAEEHELGDHNEPANYKAALLDPESNKWLDAMNVKMQSMKDNQVWDLVDLPPDGKTVGSKWLFKKKTDMDGAVHTYKARLVAKGFTQTYGVDYEETFSPVAEIRAIRILIAIAAFYDYEIWQMDVKTALLNGHLFEEVYMVQPGGFVNPKYPNRVCKLKRSIYRLKQSSKQWNKRFDDEIKKFGFTQNCDEPCVYKKASGRCFAMKDLGEAAYILRIKIYIDRSKRLIGASTPAEVKRMQNIPYASAVGSIMYAVRCTRPDVAFAQNITSRFQQNPGYLHWTAVKNIIKYLRNTKDMFLVYGSDIKRELGVSCYTDAGYLTDADDLKS